MGINLTKGQKISLTKEGGSYLNRIAVGLGWGCREVKKSGFLGFGGGIKKEDVDLDASCILYDDAKNAMDAVWWKHLRSEDGSILHTGDDRSGGGSGDDPNEVINVDLQSVPANVKSIVFVVNSYSGEDFSGIPFAFCNVVDMKTNKELGRFNLQTDGGAHKGFIIAKVYRHNNEWKFHAIGEQCSGRQQTLEEIEPLARTHA
ncbi:MAG: tellurium resistance TerZ family protein [Proteobacteria bacterium]|nr:tellurium resistance TerZ family protein [Pseudomonadota bacterium]